MEELRIIICSFVGSFAAVALFYMVIQYNEKEISPFLMFRNRRYVWLKLIHAKIRKLLIEGKTGEDVKNVIRNANFPFLIVEEPISNFVKSVLSSDELMDRYLLRISFSHKDFKSLLKASKEDRRSLMAFATVRRNLTDESEQNAEKVMPLLAEMLTRPFVVEKQPELEMHLSSGKNMVSVYQSLSDLKIVKRSCTLQHFGAAMQTLREIYPSMDIPKNRSTLYYHSDKLTSADKEFTEAVSVNTSYIKKYLRMS